MDEPKEKPTPTKFTILRDTREKEGKGWVFGPSKFCTGTESVKLDTGDYTLKGYENILAIDRKGRIEELAGNLLDERFTRELQRMKEIPHSWLFLEFNPAMLAVFPKGTHLTKAQRGRFRISGAYLIRRLWEVHYDFHVNIAFVGNKGKEFALSLFKRTIEKCPITAQPLPTAS